MYIHIIQERQKLIKAKMKNELQQQDVEENFETGKETHGNKREPKKRRKRIRKLKENSKIRNIISVLI